MPLHNHPLFKSHEEIPDPIPAHWLLQPSDKRTTCVPRHTNNTTTAVEIAFCVVELKLPGFESERQLIEHARFRDELDIAEPSIVDLRRVVNINWGNHVGMVVLKAVLEPERLAPIDLAQAYDEQSKFRGHSADEREYFENFVENWGVVERS